MSPDHYSLARLPWLSYPLRTCRSLHHCEVCGRDILNGQKYFDGGYSRRAHESCIGKPVSPQTKEP